MRLRVAFRGERLEVGAGLPADVAAELERCRFRPHLGETLATARPMRLRDFAAAHSGAQVERMVASYASAKDEAVNAPTKPDSLVIVPARLLSAEMVAGHWADHTDPKHMQDAVPLFERTPVHTMHDANPRGWCGMVTEPAWDATKLGPQQAPGINGYIAIESDLPGVEAFARGVERRSLRHWSAGFLCEMDASHPDIMSEWGFEQWFTRLGTTAPDGTLFRFIVTRIPQVYELSGVDLGAIESAVTIDAPSDRAESRKHFKAPPRRRFSLAPPVRRIPEIAP